MNDTLQTKRRMLGYILLLVSIAVLLGALHFYFHDLKQGGVYWFNLDKERNLPTWFSGILLFLFALSAFWAYSSEIKLKQSRQAPFRLPSLWLITALIALLMSLDETTILHENIYWKEIRKFSSSLGDFSYYLTQWQILFAPVVVLIMGYFILIFLNRFVLCRASLFLSFLGLALWLIAFLLEGLRESFKALSKDAYLVEVLFEEELEMMGTIFLLSSVALYTDYISQGLSDSDRLKLKRPLLNKAALAVLSLFFLFCASLGAIYYYCAIQLLNKGAPVPKLMEKTLGW